MINFIINSKFLKTINCFLAIIFIISITGCSSVPVEAPVLKIPQSEPLPSEISNAIDKLKLEKNRNSVLNLTDIAVLAIKNKNSLSETASSELIDNSLDLAIKSIEDVYSDTPEAQKARSLWYDEDSKDFKGEPYERSFVFLLRALRYFEAGDFDNTIATCKSGILQDSMSTEDDGGNFNADMASFEYLIGIAHQKLGETQEAKLAFKRAKDLKPALEIPDPANNTLVVFFAGKAPLKQRTGKYEDILWYARGESLSSKLKYTYPRFGDTPAYANAISVEDLFFQATTRGGRAVDEINEYKSQVKNTAEVIGSTAILLGIIVIGTSMMESGDSKGMMIGAGLLALGLAFHLIAKAVKTKADIRTMVGISDKIFLKSDNLLPGNNIIGVSNQASYFSLEKSKLDNTSNVIYVFTP